MNGIISRIWITNLLIVSVGVGIGAGMIANRRHHDDSQVAQNRQTRELIAGVQSVAESLQAEISHRTADRYSASDAARDFGEIQRRLVKLESAATRP
jgi:hypothetical protein